MERLSSLQTEDTIDLSAHLGVPDGPGWVTAADFYGSHDLLGDVLDCAERGYGTGNRAYAGTSVLRNCLWRMLTPAVASLFAERRLPDLSAANVALRFGEGGFSEDLAFVGPRFFALPDDPEAGHLDAVVLPSEELFVEEVRRSVSETHVARLVPALRSLRVRRGTGVLQWAAADVCAEVFVFVGRAIGREAEGVELAEGLLAGPTPLSAPLNYRVLEYPGGSEATRVRNTCCLYYKTGNGTCFTCPRKTDEERVREILEERGETLGVEEA